MKTGKRLPAFLITLAMIFSISPTALAAATSSDFISVTHNGKEINLGTGSANPNELTGYGGMTPNLNLYGSIELDSLDPLDISFSITQGFYAKGEVVGAAGLNIHDGSLTLTENYSSDSFSITAFTDYILLGIGDTDSSTVDWYHLIQVQQSPVAITAKLDGKDVSIGKGTKVDDASQMQDLIGGGNSLGLMGEFILEDEFFGQPLDFEISFSGEAYLLAAVVDSDVFDVLSGNPPHTLTLSHYPAGPALIPLTVDKPGDVILIETSRSGLSPEMVYAIRVKTGDGTTAGNQDGGGQIAGESKVEEIIFITTVPNNINFAIDPFGLGDILEPTSQVTGKSYNFTNASKVPVKLTLDFTANLNGGTELVNSPELLSPDDETVKDKKMYFGALGASSIDENDLDNVEYDVNSPGTLAEFDSIANTAGLDFMLAAGSGANPAPVIDRIASFTFYGIVNSYAEWHNDDVTVKAVYKFYAMRASTYTEWAGDSTADPVIPRKLVGVNQVSTGSGIPGFIIGGDMTDATPEPGEDGAAKFEFTKGSVNVVIPFNLAGNTISSVIAWGSEWQGVANVASSFTITPGGIAMADIWAQMTGYSIRCTLSDGTVWRIDISHK